MVMQEVEVTEEVVSSIPQVVKPQSSSKPISEPSTKKTASKKSAQLPSNQKSMMSFFAKK